MTVCFGAVWTHKCFILLMKMDHITQSSCEDKSLRWCCFDYHAVSVTIWLHPACFFYEEETVSVIMLLSVRPSWRAEAEPAGCSTECLIITHSDDWYLSQNCLWSPSLSNGRLSLRAHLTGRLHDNRQMSALGHVISCCWCDFNTELLKQINTKNQDLLCSFLAPYLHSW